MYRRILVAADGTELSAKAVKAALRMARDFNGTVLALNVQAPYQPPIAGEVPAAFLHDPEEYDRLAEEASHSILQPIADQAKEMGVDCETRTVFDHSVSGAIVEVSKADRVDLIVMASHGRSGLRNLLLGSETRKVLTHCQIPVLVHR
ncbi:MAG: universal stress protein [Burkholderiaceae bacterium]